MAKWALIDFSWLAHRAMHAMGNLHHGGQATGVLFGVLEQLRTVCADPKLRTTWAALFFDSRQSHRKRQFPGYKAKRQERSPEELAQLEVMHEQRDLLWRALPEMGFRVHRQTGLESDDLMAYAAKWLSGPQASGVAGVMVTADGDLWQCITDHVHWYDPARGTYYDPVGFFQAKGLEPHSWASVKCLSGCRSDNVPGIPGVGEATAVDYLRKTLNPRSKRHAMLKSADGMRVTGRNSDLVCLPHPRTLPFDLVEPHYKPDVFWSFCKQYGLRSYLDGRGRREWEMFFAGRTGEPVPRKRGEPRGV